MQQLKVSAGSTGTSRNKWAGLGVLAAGLSMIVIDGTIVGVSLPTIIADLHLDLNEAQWVNSLYSVVLAALLLSSGRLGDRIGRRKLFMAGVVLFMAGSIFAALSHDAGGLILSRVLQGVGGAAVLPATLSSVNSTFFGKDRTTAFAIWGAVISGMAAIGPLLGGWLTSSFAWQWIFIVNIPLGLAVLVGAVLFVPETRSPNDAAGFDILGLLLSAAGFGLFVFALIEGPTLGWWSAKSALKLGLISWPADATISAVPLTLAAGIVLLISFVLWEKHRATVGRSAILDLTLFRVRTFSWGNAVAAMVAIGEFGLLLILPLYLINILGLGTLDAGFVLAAMALGAFFSGASARHLASRLGPPTVVIIGLALETAGLLVLALVITSTTSIWLIAALLVVYGLGLGLASAQLTGTVLADIPTTVSGQGSATQSTVRQLGAALGSAIMGTVLAHFAVSAGTKALEAVQGLPASQVGTLAGQLRDSAGGVVPQLAQLGTHGPLGAAGPAAVEAMSSGFAQAASAAVLAAAMFLFIGLVGSFFVAAASRRTAREGGS
ncbi:DHA2 family efflux MFS transporter permease subunit [Arthrobacter psychrochitiniphilus]|uniref:MFS transporter n=1 Tax=Arthrobacter psychrochitiniphilus TaxID=291045 RepID=A0A2V3DZ28_9MICC|nr:DHA2 family efflux MFS transporter permease subunit [Arthrobacter psychrochitiniphilus]NYG18985.1 EmrB/QacA subfamily drug resistance transporter [Arthrobacter psychrochitiniphilus]PXA66023.1 MFS transporter [Arthrobacter psychrochitiniphilus]